ncbi:hypothetical protein [Marivita sp. GX14005]|uniref:hypothetical protein n=1 Tax=Marivita sp. GX14005 TaxID=2942276 RepID=UPI0020194582|nr:hypothetical protein [Marivita sp. GX14005]MCL3883314.1 hypothetical protein [Marivita sp. GX14005]
MVNFWSSNVSNIIAVPSPNGVETPAHRQIPGAAAGGLGAEPTGDLATVLAERNTLVRTNRTLLQTIDTRRAEIKTLQADLAAENAKPTPDAEKVKTLKAAIETAEEAIETAKTSIATNIETLKEKAATLIAGGMHPSTVTARGVFQHLDGKDVTVPGGRPADFGDANPKTFLQWHSAVQAEWLLSQNVAPGAVKQIDLGAAKVNVMLSNDGKTVIPVDQLTISDIARLSQADQSSLTDATIWKDLAARLNLTKVAPSGGPPPTYNTDVMSALRSEITKAETTLGAGNAKVFMDQLDLLARRAGASKIAAGDLLDSEAGAIGERFRRALAFASVPEPAKMTISQYLLGLRVNSKTEFALYVENDIGTFGRASSTDGNATIKQGLAEFMRAERAIRASTMARDAMAPLSGGVRDPRMDVANLIFRLQSLYETQAEGVADSGTEEIKQLHRLLNDYARMQRMVTETVKLFDPSNTDQTLGLIGADYDNSVFTDPSPPNEEVFLTNYSFSVKFDGKVHYPHAFEGARVAPPYWFRTDTGSSLASRLSDEDLAAVSMFSLDTEWFGESVAHPIEALYRIERPRQGFISEGEYLGWLEQYKKTSWDGYSTQLSDTVTQLNQQNQIKQNEIENATKQRNRHFDLGNNALSKMNEMLQAIGRM